MLNDQKEDDDKDHAVVMETMRQKGNTFYKQGESSVSLPTVSPKNVGA